ncbi:AEC family transporter [Arcobacter arenosus]|jgi:predicted permease|uniref:AEC family transporter n=1 Tax=Arcobacter arenosus TaxID=2576037 RepID=A0A5R8Y1C2_9BACT|nr:AEC family transporter [Arcobacter arenosus]TLP38568.1 AEC family transporter [Arcobacter arenosus]
MEHIFSALIPIFLLILIGYFFKRIKFPSNEFWANADKLTYFVLMPSLLVYKLSTASLDGLEAFDFVLTGILGITTLLFITIILNFKFKTAGPAFSSVIQGAVRFNTYVLLALISAIYGDKGIALTALLITFAIPFINFICITSFAVYVSDKKATLFGLLKSIITNPLIVACFIGGGINYLDIGLPIIGENVLKILSASALPMGLLSIGFSLDLSSIKEAKLELVLASFLKLLIMPIVMFVIARLFGLEGILLSLLLIFGSMPTAPSSFILARQLGGDSRLMASIITLQTLVSLLTVSIVLWALQFL